MRHDYFSLAYSNLIPYTNNTVIVQYQLGSFPGLHASFCYCTNSKWEWDRNWVGRPGNQAIYWTHDVIHHRKLQNRMSWFWCTDFTTTWKWRGTQQTSTERHFSMVVICSVYKCRGSANVEMLYKQARCVILCLGSAKPRSQTVFRAISPWPENETRFCHVW